MSARAAASGASAAKWLAAGALGGTLLGGLLMAIALRAGVEKEPAHPRSGTLSSAGAAAELAGSALAAMPLASAAEDGGDEGRQRRAAPNAAEPARPLGSEHAAMQHPGPSAEPSRRPASAAARKGRARRAGAPTSPVSSSSSRGAGRGGASSRVTSLEREIARLDAIRVANANGDFARGLELVALYRAEFDHGELARDADVFEIEALTGEGERARAARAARAFLDRYPDDPHAQRVRALAAATAP